MSQPGPPASGPAATPAGGQPRSRARDWRTYVGGLGRVLISLGVLVLLFVVYQLWGTGLQEAQAQRDLQSRFARIVGTAPAATIPGTVAATVGGPGSSASGGSGAPAPSAPSTAAATTAIAGAPTTAVAPAVRPAPNPGDPVARLRIPRIGLDKIIVEGVQLDDLKQGPGHYPTTPLPGEAGNAAIAGHRTTYGAPFYRVDELRPGDAIEATTYAGTYVYTVTGTRIVSPEDASALAPTQAPTLTLTSCHPKYSTSQRIIVQAVLDPARSAQLVPPPATAPPPPPTTAPAPAGTQAPAATDAAGSTVPDNPVVATAPAVVSGTAGTTSAADSFARGWFSDDGAWPHVALWGLVLTALSVGAWLLGTRLMHRQWLAALLAVLPFLVALYFFYENVARLLPPNV